VNDRSGRLPGQGSVAVRRMSPGEMVNACQVLGLAFADNPRPMFMATGTRRGGPPNGLCASSSSAPGAVTCSSPSRTVGSPGY
jgi:hypothetical protein